MPTIHRMRLDAINHWVAEQIMTIRAAEESGTTPRIVLDPVIVETVVRGFIESRSLAESVILRTHKEYGTQGSSFLVQLIDVIANDAHALELTDSEEDRGDLIVFQVYAAFMARQIGTTWRLGMKVRENRFVDMLLTMIEDERLPSEILPEAEVAEMLEKAEAEVDAG